MVQNFFYTQMQEIKRTKRFLSIFFFPRWCTVIWKIASPTSRLSLSVYVCLCFAWFLNFH